MEKAEKTSEERINRVKGKLFAEKDDDPRFRHILDVHGTSAIKSGKTREKFNAVTNQIEL